MKVWDSDIYTSTKSVLLTGFCNCIGFLCVIAVIAQEEKVVDSYLVIHHKSQNCMKKINYHFLLLTEPPQDMLDTALAPLGHLSLGLTC